MISCGFQTVASGLTIRCGLGHAVEVSNPLATVCRWRRRTSTPKVGYAWQNIVWNLSAYYGGLGNGYNSYHAQKKHTCKVKASHYWEKSFFVGSSGIGKLSLNWEWCDFGVNRCSVYIERIREVGGVNNALSVGKGMGGLLVVGPNSMLYYVLDFGGI